ncbi:MAG: hypothetical protein AMXMBFR6_20970 [Betaproteobacteria bacterium]
MYASGRRVLVDVLCMVFFSAVMSLLPDRVVAQSYPTKPIRLIVPYPAGQGTDIISRVIAERLSGRLGQQIIVDNRPGAGGNIGTELAAKAIPNGYTLIMGTTATHAMNSSLYSSVPFDHINDFVPIILVGTFPMILVANPAISANSIQEVIKLSRAMPGAINFGIASTSSRVSFELFKRSANIDVVPVLYKGATTMFTDLIGDRIQFGFETVAAAQPQVKAGKVKPIAITSSKRSDLAPMVPTFAESGIVGYDVVVWVALFAPRGTPAEVVGKLNGEVEQILLQPDLRQRIMSIGYDPGGGSADQLATYVKSETQKWSQIIKAAGIRAD